MTNGFEELQKFGKEHLEATSTAAAALAKGWQSIAAETSDYSKKAMEAHTACLEELIAAKSIDSAMQIQSDYAKATYEGFIEQTKKMGDLCGSLAKDAFKPMETAMARASAG